MGSLSNMAANALLNHLCNTAFTSVTPIYVALCTADPTDAGVAGSMSEVPVANGYSRKAVTFSAAAARRVVQSGAVTFDQATGAGWPAISHWAIVSSASGAGDMYAYGSFVSPFTPVAGNTPTIPSTELEVEISATAGGAGFSDYLVHAWLNRMFRNVAFAKPATYVGLALSIIDDQDVAIGDVTEVSTAATSYARVLVNTNASGIAPKWTVASVGTIENADTISFPTPSGSWGAVVSMFLIDSGPAGGTAGNILGYDNPNLQNQTPISGDTVQFAATALDLALS